MASSFARSSHPYREQRETLGDWNQFLWISKAKVIHQSFAPYIYLFLVEVKRGAFFTTVCDSMMIHFFKYFYLKSKRYYFIFKKMMKLYFTIILSSQNPLSKRGASASSRCCWRYSHAANPKERVCKCASKKGKVVVPSTLTRIKN